MEEKNNEHTSGDNTVYLVINNRNQDPVKSQITFDSYTDLCDFHRYFNDPRLNKSFVRPQLGLSVLTISSEYFREQRIGFRETTQEVQEIIQNFINNANSLKKYNDEK